MSNQIDSDMNLNYTLRNDHNIPLKKLPNEPNNIRAFRIFMSVLRANSDHGNQRAKEAYHRYCNFLGEHSKNLPILVAEFIGTNYFKIICKEFEIKKQTCYTSCAPTPHEEDRKFLVFNSKTATPKMYANGAVYNSNLATPHYGDVKQSCQPVKGQVYNSNFASKPTSQPTSQPTSHPTSQPTSQPTSRPTSRPTSQPTSRYATPRGKFIPKHPAFQKKMERIDECDSSMQHDSSDEEHPSIEELEADFDRLSTKEHNSAELEIAHNRLKHRREDDQFRHEQANRELQLYGRNKPYNAETSPSRSEHNIGIAPIKMEMPRSFTSITVVDHRNGKASNIFTTETSRLNRVELDGMGVHFK